MLWERVLLLGDLLFNTMDQDAAGNGMDDNDTVL